MAEVVEEKQFETTQNVVAAYLVYNGFDIAECTWENGVCTYFFVDTGELRDLLMKYISNEALVEPQGFNNAFTQVRNRMFQAKDGG